MQAEICNTKINYKKYGEGPNIILLHGWGQNIEMMEPLGDFLSANHTVWILDLPGFGESEEPPFAWDIYDYATMLNEFIVDFNIEKPSLIGHSLGGRIAIIYASKHQNVDKVVLLDAAGVKPKRTADYYLKVYTYKTMKAFAKIPGIGKIATKKQKNAGSEDYQNASDCMKQVLTKVVNEDLTYLFKDIKAPTLLIWGEEDEATPLSDGQLMEKEIPNAALISFPGAGHYAYLERLGDVQRILNSFFS